MSNTIYCRVRHVDMEAITKAADECLDTMRSYVPGCRFRMRPILRDPEDDIVMLAVEVEGAAITYRPPRATWTSSTRSASASPKRRRDSCWRESMSNIIITDTTLRDGSHSVRHQFSVEDTRRIVEALDEAPDIIEVGHGDAPGSTCNYGFSGTRN